MERIMDRSNGKIAYYSKILIDGFGLIAKTSKLGEEYLIQFYRPDKIQKDTRESIFRIFHFPPFNGKDTREKLHPKIDFVIDLENHPITRPFHLNLSGLSKKICNNCPKCKKYFSSLDHFEIVAVNGVGRGDPYKIIDWDLTADKFIEELKELGFFNEFKQIFKNKIY